MNSRLVVIFGIGRHLYHSPFFLTFELTLFLNSEDVSLMLYARFLVLDNLIQHRYQKREREKLCLVSVKNYIKINHI